MGDFEAPSFSLGFDFDFDHLPEPQITPTPPNELTKQPSNTSNGDIPVADDDFEIETLTVADSDDDDNNEEVRPRLKRLRRGCSADDKGISGFGKCKSTVDLGSVSGLGSVVVDDDDIEDFSSPEDNNAKDENLSTQHHSVSNSSKLPLTGLGVLTKESGKRKQNVANVTSAPESVITSCSKQPFPKLTVSPLRKFQLIDSDSDSDIPSITKVATNKTSNENLSTQHHSVSNSSKLPLTGLGVLTKESGKRKQNVANVTSAPESVITSCSKQPFPKLTVSPLRKFQLIDSDSDSDIPSITKVATNKTSSKPESYLKKEHCLGLNQQRKVNESLNTSRKDLWEDFKHEKSFHIPTPALDEVCEEFFSSLKDKNKAQSNVGKSNHNSHVMDSVIDLEDPRPPAHQYFFHNDLRIQELVRIRLCNFFPLNAEDRGSEQPSTSNIDYMGQFSNGDKTKQAARSNKAETSSSRKNSRKSKTQEMSQGFTNPKVNTAKGITKDAGKRRVQADGQATGHWFTNGDGKRVYVSKNGQEMTGKAAYIHYKKESGGFKNKKAKKTSTKKK